MKNKTKSQKGTWGHVGAPLKPVKFPTGSFTIDRVVALNADVCELTVRKRVTAAIKGFYTTGSKKNKNLRKIEVPITHQYGEPIPQPKGAVGRPNHRIVPVGNPAAKLTSAPRCCSKPKTATVVTVTTPAPVTPVTTPAVTTPVATAPVNSVEEQETALYVR
jgi:hypothetical protein